MRGFTGKGLKAWEKFLAEHDGLSLDEITANLEGLHAKDLAGAAAEAQPVV